MKMTQTLSQSQLADYHRDGYVVLRGAISESEILRLEQGVANNPPLDGTLDPNAPIYPAPGRYTLATHCARDPDLAFIIEHPTIVGAVREVLNDDPKLTAYVIYDRTPQGAGLPAHHDYKRWRPVGSSMHWLFTIVPFCDFDAEAGPLFVAPGSHRLERVKPGQPMEIDAAVRPNDDAFVDPGLRRGDLLLMNMHLWHRADANHSAKHRVGLFNKYAAASYPPATGYYLYHSDVAEALSPDGRNLLAVHSSQEIVTTRVLLMRERGASTEVLLRETRDGLCLPGGLARVEKAIPDWDEGNFIASAQQHLREQLLIEAPWLSYVGDYAEHSDGLCRLYAYTLNNNGFPVPYEGVWVDTDTLTSAALTHDWLAAAVATWQDPNIVRGKGLSQAQCRLDQFAY